MIETNKGEVAYVDGIELFACNENFAIVKLTEPDDVEFPYLIASEVKINGCDQNEYLTVKSFADTNDYIAFSHSDLLELKKLIEHVTKEP